MVAPAEDQMAGMDEIVRYYSELFNEDTRLCEGLGAIELARTQAILSRELPPPPATVLDVGGGPGRYARWLVERGYTVHLIDIVPRHVEQARRALANTSGTWTATVGDARRLELADGSLDAVLLMGPLYHVQAREERVTILREAWRVLRPRGILCAAAISRFASLIDGISSGFVADPSFREIVRADIATGRHVNPTADSRYFTTAYLHHPTELRDELARAGFGRARVLAVEGILWAARDPAVVAPGGPAAGAVLEAMQQIEEDPSLIGASPHLMAVATRPT